MNKIKNVAIIGAGTMGCGIAISILGHDIDVTLIDTNQETLDRAQARAQKYLDRQVEKQKMSVGDAQAALSHLRTSLSMKEAVRSNLVIEAVFEDIDVKRSVFTTLERIVGANTLLATNTSALKISDIGAELIHPDRLCGIHYFSPAEINRGVEVIKGDATAPETIAAVMPFLIQCRKKPIECHDQSGFALNRFFCPYTNEAARCLDEGLATPSQIDEVAKEVFGVPVGPFLVMNIVKPRINLAAVRNLASLGSFYAPADSLQKCGEADEQWDLIAGESDLIAERRVIISDRLKGAVFFAVLEELNEKVATPEAIDLGACTAFAFASGPVEMMKNEGRAEVIRLIDNVVPGSSHLAAVLLPET